jgi:hypothetical protein
MVRVSERNELLNGSHQQIGIVLVDLFERRPQLDVLNDGICENAVTADDRASRYLAGYLLDQLTAGPIDIAIPG